MSSLTYGRRNQAHHYNRKLNSKHFLFARPEIQLGTDNTIRGIEDSEAQYSLFRFHLVSLNSAAQILFGVF